MSFLGKITYKNFVNTGSGIFNDSDLETVRRLREEVTTAKLENLGANRQLKKVSHKRFVRLHKHLLEVIRANFKQNYRISIDISNNYHNVTDTDLAYSCKKLIKAYSDYYAKANFDYEEKVNDRPSLERQFGVFRCDNMIQFVDRDGSVLRRKCNHIWCSYHVWYDPYKKHWKPQKCDSCNAIRGWSELHNSFDIDQVCMNYRCSCGHRWDSYGHYDVRNQKFVGKKEERKCTNCNKTGIMPHSIEAREYEEYNPSVGQHHRDQCKACYELGYPCTAVDKLYPNYARN